VSAASDDNQPTSAVGGVDETVVVDSPRTVAAEQHSEAPTTIVRDVRPTRAAELAWSTPDVPAETMSAARIAAITATIWRYTGARLQPD
jgi:hypothetical protein